MMTTTMSYSFVKCCSSWRIINNACANTNIIKRSIVNDLKDLGYTPDKLPGPLRIDTFSQKQITNLKVQEAIKKMRIHEADTGSAPAQIAAMTERIQNITRHFAMHKKDNHSLRGFQMLVSRRKKMLAYLKRSDFNLFKETVRTIGLQKEALNIK